MIKKGEYMFDINNWTNIICDKIKSVFSRRVLFIGFQGSYRRGEASETSDIDMVVILDKLGIEDLKKYKKIVSSMENNDKACGFIGGADELKHWSKAEIFQLYNDTKPLYGNLADFVKIPDKKDAQQAVSVGAQGLYHGACHSFLYSKDLKKNLYELYKQIFFILQAKYFVKYNEYISSKNELFSKLDGTEKELMNICLNREKILNYNEKETESAYNMLIEFCSQQIKSL